MCGIFGVVRSASVRNAYNDNVNKFLNNCFLAGAVRGTDACGVYQIGADNHIYMDKASVPASSFLTRKQAHAIIADACDSPLTIGHNRAATAGAVVDANAHPFLCGDIVGVHNGTLSGEGLSQADFEVDSEWALNQMNTFGVKEALETSITGAYAFVVYNSADKHLYIARNSERVLHAAYVGVESHRTMLIASEAGMLHWLAARNNFNIVDDALLSFTPGVLYKINPDTLDIEKIPYKPATYTYYTDARGSTKGGYLYADDYGYGSLWGYSAPAHPDQRHKLALQALRGIVSRALGKIVNIVNQDDKISPNVTEQMQAEAKRLGILGCVADVAGMYYDAGMNVVHGECMISSNQGNEADVLYCEVHGLTEEEAGQLCYGAAAVAPLCKAVVVGATGGSGTAVTAICEVQK